MYYGIRVKAHRKREARKASNRPGLKRREEKDMHLNELLKLCLLALQSRCPTCRVDINADILELQTPYKKGWTVSELLEFLAYTSPDLLQAPAHLVLNAQEESIYLVDRSEITPAMWIYDNQEFLPDSQVKDNLAQMPEMSER
jgi:hypothetical protein